MAEDSGTVLTRRALLGGFWFALLLLAYWVLRPFLAAIVWAGILVYVSWPLYLYLRAWISKPNTSALLMTVLLGAVFALPLLGIFELLRGELPEAYRKLARYLTESPELLPDFVTRIPLLGSVLANWQDQWTHDPESFRNQLAASVQPWLDELAFLFGDLGRNLMKFALALLTAFFFYRDGKDLTEQIRRVLLRFLGKRAQAYIVAVTSTTRAVLYGLVFTALAQGLLAGLGYWVAGVGAPVLLGAVTAIVALIPFGAPVVWLMVVGSLLFSGEMIQGIGLLLWCMLVVSQADNVIRPLVISGVTKIPFLLVMFGVLGGIGAFGLVGLFLGPMVMAVWLAVWREWAAENRLSSTSAV